MKSINLFIKTKRVLITLLLITAGVVSTTAQSTADFERVLCANAHNITFKTSGYYYAHPEYISSVELNNDHLIIRFVSKEKEHQYAKEENVIYTVNINLLDLSSINKESVPLNNWNDCEYGVRINLMKNNTITKQSSKSTITNTDLNHFLVACRTQKIQEQLFNLIKDFSESYLYKTPKTNTELEKCFNDLNSFFSTYKLKSSSYGYTWGYRRNDNYEMKNIKITFKDMLLTISFNDYCADCYDDKKIAKEIMIPVNKCVVNAEKYVSSDLCIKSDEGFEYIEKGEKTIINRYLFYGDDAVVKQGCKLLNAFIDGVVFLNYSGSFGVSNTPKQTKAKSDSQKKISNTFGQ